MKNEDFGYILVEKYMILKIELLGMLQVDLLQSIDEQK
jgi:hypothetical protein